MMATLAFNELMTKKKTLVKITVKISEQRYGCRSDDLIINFIINSKQV